MALAIDSKADPKAVAVARAVYDAVPLDSVILFGSRARGDHREDSDIDLMLICDGYMSKENYRKATIAAHDAIKEAFGIRWIIGVDLVLIDKSEYLRCRGGINHITAQAARDGVDMNGDKQEYQRDPEPFDWGDINQRIINTNRELITLDWLIEGRMPQESIGFHAQQALENILKAWISAIGSEYKNTHDINELLAVIRRSQDEQHIAGSDDMHWLKVYAVKYRYTGAVVGMSDPIELYDRIDCVVSDIEQRIKSLTGVDDLPRYTPPGQSRADD